MDKYVIKNSPDFLHVRGRQDLACTLCDVVKSKKIICVYGKPGVGKTHLVKSVLGDNRIDLDQSILKSKTQTHNFMECVRYSHSNILIDDFDIELQGSKEITGPISLGATIIVCDTIKNIDFSDCLEVSAFNEDEINVLWPGYPEAARRSGGNLHNFFFYKQFSDDKDRFMNPRDFIKELLSVQRGSYIFNSMEEHGHSMSVIHENYIDACKDCMVDVSECLSIADIYDSEMYKTNWDYINYFQVVGIATSCYHIGGSLDSEKIRPGSCWTKHNNMKMRLGKIKKLRMDITTLIYLLNFIKANPTIALYYSIQPSDIDVLNHLLLRKKFKSSEIHSLKKRISFLYQ